MLILGGISALLLDWYHKQPQVVTTIGDVSLGMTPVEVTLALGQPDVDSNDLGEKRDFRVFLYEGYTGRYDYVIGFSEEDGQEHTTLVCSYSTLHRIFGIGRWDKEARVIQRLGVPSHTSIRDDGLEKRITYSKWYVAFEIAKGEVQAVCVTKDKPFSYPNEYSNATL